MLGFIVMWFVVFCLIMIFEDLDENDVSLWCVMLQFELLFKIIVRFSEVILYEFVLVI